MSTLETESTFIDLKELAIILKISKSTAYKISFKNVLPKYSFSGGKIYFKRAEVLQLLENNRIASQSEVEAKARA